VGRGVAEEVFVEAPVIAVEEGASVLVVEEEAALATVDVVALEEEEVEVSGHQKEVDSEGGVVAEVHREGEVVQEVDLGQEGRLLSSPTGTKECLSAEVKKMLW